MEDNVMRVGPTALDTCAVCGRFTRCHPDGTMVCDGCATIRDGEGVMPLEQREVREHVRQARLKDVSYYVLGDEL
jgi:recombinational DNA repair protein RecR